MNRLLGRDPELQAIADALARAQTTVIALVGEAGMGKSELIRAARKDASDRGWLTIPADAADKLVMSEHTTIQDLWLRVVAAVTTATTAGGADRVTRAAAPLPTVGEIPEVWHATLERYAPALICIDGYEPGADLRRWHGGLVSSLRADGTPVAWIVAAEPTARAALDALGPDVLLELGPLAPDVLRDMLEPLAVRHRFEAGELEAYVEALRNHPELIGSLERLLRLGLRDAA